MVPVKQTVGGGRGNCFAACLASLIECELAAVDFACADYPRSWDDVARAKIAPFGFTLVHIVADLRGSAPIVHGRALYITHGPSSRGWRHACIYRCETDYDPQRARQVLVHDPAAHLTDDPGLRRVDGVTLLLPMSMRGTGDPARVEDGRFVDTACRPCGASPAAPCTAHACYRDIKPGLCYRKES